jgi:endonuclease YncB( thermonuclease family)
MRLSTILESILIAGFLFFGATAPAVLAEPLEAVPRVVDGDTIVIGSTRIRLQGIDAPETDQICLDQQSHPIPCGLRARDALSRLIANQPIRCIGDELDQYGRRLMTCSVAGRDLNAEMVRSGWALAFTRYSRKYVEEESIAKQHASGMWAGAFIAPWDWRHRGPQTIIFGSLSVPTNAQSILLPSTPEASGAVKGCVIKGNINRNGERIYHLPGMRFYERTRIVEQNGERWFCTEDEARAAGWRKARQ